MRFVARSVAGGPAVEAAVRPSNRQTYGGLWPRTLVGMVDGGKATAFHTRLARRGYGIRALGASGSMTLNSNRLVDDPRPIVLVGGEAARSSRGRRPLSGWPEDHLQEA